MPDTTCDAVETFVQLRSQYNENEPEVSLPSLTEVVESGRCWQPPVGGVFLPSVKLTVRLSFATGEEIITSAETPATFAGRSEEPVVPYTFSGATEQPVLVSSSNFVEFG